MLDKPVADNTMLATPSSSEPESETLVYKIVSDQDAGSDSPSTSSDPLVSKAADVGQKKRKKDHSRAARSHQEAKRQKGILSLKGLHRLYT